LLVKFVDLLIDLLVNGLFMDAPALKKSLSLYKSKLILVEIVLVSSKSQCC